MKAPAKVGWVLLAIFAVENSIVALRYLLPSVPFAAPLDNFLHHRSLLALHALGGAVALLAGPMQLLPPFREKHWTFHRRMGWIYCGAVLLGSVAALRLAVHTQTGFVAGSGFFLLAVVWLIATALAVNFILRGNADRHRRWMIRSYALAAAAITLRIYLPLSLVMHLPFSAAYPAIAWLCWVPNLMAIEVYLRFAPNATVAMQKADAPS